MLLLTKLNQLVNNFLGSTGAGVGNLIAEGDSKRIQQVFWELSSLRFMVASFLTFALYHLMDSFIVVWLGTEYVLPHSVLVVILANFSSVSFAVQMISLFMAMVFFKIPGRPLLHLVSRYWQLWLEDIIGDFQGLVRRCCQFHNYHKHLETLFLYRYGFKMSVGIYWKNVLLYLCMFVFLGL